MTKKVEINTLNEKAVEQAGVWSRAEWDEAVVQSFMEAEAETEERTLEWAREVIEKFHEDEAGKE